MSTINIEELKDKFSRGRYPKENDYSDLIDTIFENSGNSGESPSSLVFVSNEPPASPDEGQLWMDTSSNILKVFVEENFLEVVDVTGIIAEIVGQAPETLDTLEELALALGEDPNFATTITNALAGKASTSHTHAISEVTNLETTLDSKANLSGATFTGAIQGNVRQSVTNRTANFSITSTMAGTVQRFTSASNLTVTIDNVFSIGDRVDILRDNTGEVTIAAGSGVTLVSPETKRRLNERYSAATVICVASGVYHIIGDLRV
jgi:hypothetical protein